MEKEIIKVIDELLGHFEAEKFYIGKTSNYKERYDFHKQVEGYNFMWKLARGTEQQIANLESVLLKHYENDPKNANRNGGSAGHPGTILYMCLKVGRNLDITEVYDEEVLAPHVIQIK